MGLNINTINRRLQEENVNLAGGSLLDGQTQYLVRTLNEFRTIDEIANLVVGDRNNIEIRVKDVGQVYRTHKEREIITRVNGVESVEIEIFKEADANIVATAQRVRDRLFGTPEQLAYIEQLKAGENRRSRSQRPAGTGAAICADEGDDEFYRLYIARRHSHGNAVRSIDIYRIIGQ